MSNHHLRNKELSLKAKGLLSQMLSLPEDWDYTLAGLSHINREKIDAIREAVKELEKAGYIVRSRERDEKGRLRGADYVIYEQPQPREPEAATSGGQPPILDLPTLENPTFVWPSSNQDYWRPKILRNVERDKKNTEELKALGWNVITVWECELKRAVREENLNLLITEIQQSKS